MCLVLDMCINKNVDKNKKAGKEILQKANSISYKTIDTVDMIKICELNKVIFEDVMQIIKPYITPFGSTRTYKLTETGILFIANGFWEKNDLEIECLEKQKKYASATFWVAFVAAIAGIIAAITGIAASIRLFMFS